MKIHVILPVIANDYIGETEGEFGAVARDDAEITVTAVEHGPASIESSYDVAFAVPDILSHVKQAQQAGADAVIINCMADPGVDAAREVASIPVVGVGEASLRLASSLAHKFSVISILERDIPDLDRMFRKFRLSLSVASVRVIDFPVLDLTGNEDRVAEAASEAAIKAVEEDGAGAIAFGCSGLSGVVRRIDSSLRSKGFHVPVINPAAAAVKLAESLADMELSFSKITYPDPPEKKIIYPDC